MRKLSFPISNSDSDELGILSLRNSWIDGKEKKDNN
jgi:hypothetical protein